jgi:hypothetical protein
MRKNVIIVGVPRSGTSMTAFIFANKGYFAAHDPETELRGGDEFNPTGYWEAQQLIEANVEVLHAAGYPHHNTWLFDSINETQAAQISAVPPTDKHRELVQSYDAHAPWIWKDPRLCYTLGYWWPLLNPETTAVLFLTRNLDHVFQSFLRMGWRANPSDHDEVVGRLRAHRAAAETIITRLKIPHVTIAYEDFKNQPQQTAQTLSRFFGLELGPADLQFSDQLNHSSRKGRIVARLEQMASWLPAGLRRVLKKSTPRNLWATLFPGRKQ